MKTKRKLYEFSSTFHACFKLFAKRYGNIPTKTPPQRGRQMQAGMKIRDFQPISRFISEMIQDGASDVIKAKLLGPRPQPSRPRPLRLRLEHKDTQYV